MRVFNFAAGPATLPLEVLTQAQSEMTDWKSSGMSVMEVSHRSKAFVAVAQEAEADLRELLAIPSNYKVLFLQGGATGMFSAIPMNLATAESTVDYVNTGAWSKKAIGEAKRYCKVVNVSADEAASNYSTVPAQAALRLTPGAAYFHYTPNETIGGVEFDYIPDTGQVPLVADLSSTLLSRPLEVSKFGLIYAGAQKNIGPSGIVVVIVRDDLIGKARPGTPMVWDFKAMADDGSMLNTPPTFGWYFAGLVFKWLKKQGGLQAMEARNRAKAQRLYGFIDGSKFYRSPVARNARSWMNVPFTLAKPELDKTFCSEAAKAGLVNLEGHRSVGGMRASIYNAMPPEGVDALVAFMHSFETRHHPDQETSMRFKIQTLNNISIKGLERLPRERFEVASEIGHPDAILVRSADMHKLKLPDSLLAVGRAGAGTNNIPVEALSRRGIPVFNAPGANANAVKELVLAGMFLAARNICQAWTFAKAQNGDDHSIDVAVEKGKKNFVGFELPGRTLGVIGLGAIGVEVANSALGLGMKVLGYDPQITVQRAWQLSSNVEQALSLDDLFVRSDIISVHVPLTPDTRGLVNEARLKLMRKNGVILNFARAPIVDEKAVVHALDDGRLQGYVCDFPSNATKDHPKIVTLPHLGASTNEAEDNCAIMVADTVKDYLENGNIRNSVNFPEAALPRAPKTARICIANSNVPNMVGQISTALADASLNIAELLNKSRGEYAYTLIDTDGAVDATVLDKIRAISGVLAARVI